MTKLYIMEFELFKKTLYRYWHESFTQYIHEDSNPDLIKLTPNPKDKNINFPTEKLYGSSINDFQEQVFGWNSAIEALRKETEHEV